MHSTFYIFDYDIPGYGAMISFGILVVWIAASRLGHHSRVGPDMATSLLIAALLGGFIGGKALAVITEWAYYGRELSRIIYSTQGGVAYGAIIGALCCAALYARIRKFRILDALDVAALLICTGQIFGRIGCFLAGCCYGKPAAWGVSFPADSMAYKALRRGTVQSYDFPLTEGQETIPLIPTQLLESGAMVLLTALLFFLLRKKLLSGMVFFTYIGGYAVFRFIIEYFRLDPERGTVLGDLLSTSQFIASLMLLLSIAGFVMRKRLSPPIKA
jgi:phosphatidylglycerol:prolipoprotein diacylglycerol transferase